MKKVLIIANLYHASPRIPAIARYFYDMGWEPTILTVPLKDDLRGLLWLPKDMEGKVKIIEADYKGDVFSFWRRLFNLFGFNLGKSILMQAKEKIGSVSKKTFIDYLFRAYKTIFSYPDEERTWRKPAFKKAEEILKNEKFDAMISSSSPVTAHIIASRIKRKHNIFWIADLRDLWTQNNDYCYPNWRKFFEKRLELRTLSSADILVTVSLPLEEKLRDFHKKDKVYTITNGFDKEELNIGSLSDKFLITYAGTLYTGKQDPENLFIAINELIEEKVIDKQDLDIRFYSGNLFWLNRQIKKFNLENIVKLLERIPRTEIIKMQASSQILFLIYLGDKRELGWQSLKIFGYLASRRPILAINGPGKDVIERMVRKTNSGVYCQSIKQIKEFLKKSYLEYKQTGEVSYNGNLQEINKHSYKMKSGQFIELLNKSL